MHSLQSTVVGGWRVSAPRITHHIPKKLRTGFTLIG